MAQQNQTVNDTLLSNQQQHQPLQELSPPSKSDKIRTKVLAVIMLATIAVFVITMIVSNGSSNTAVPPTSIKLTLLDNTTTVMKVGTSRVVDVLFFSGNDNRSESTFQSVTEKTVHWRTFPEGIIQVDQYGRVQALAVGTATLKVMSMYDFSIWDSKKIQVVENKKMISTNKRIINFNGEPRKPYRNAQKTVTRYLKNDIPSIPEIPDDLKKESQDPQNATIVKKVTQGNITWEIVDYADGSSRNYIKRTDNEVHQRDHQMYFIGQRYLTEEGFGVIKLRSDDNNGIWMLSEYGNINHIAIEEMSYSHKAELMTNDTKKNVMRHGFASDAQFNGQKWVSGPSDNDGLWTGMYGTGQLIKYAVLKQQKAAQSQIKQARMDALKSLKAVLLAANVAGRNGTVDAKIRRYNCSFKEVYLSQDYLKKGKQYNIDSYPGSPADGIGFFGQDAGQVVDGAYEGGNKTYTYKPYKPEDWTKNEEPATTKRTLNGYFARTFYIPALEGNKTLGGTWFKRNTDGTQTVISGANTLYDYTNEDHPTFNLGNLDIPDVLADLQTIQGRKLKADDFSYKGDTSTDSLIGHLFIYKVAFDVLDDEDQEERQVKELIVDTMISLAQMFVNNGYSHVDATGQGTKWTRLHRDFLISDYTLPDSPLKAFELLLIFKLCYYVTGDSQWDQQYQLLVKHPSFKYVDLVSTLWKRWVWRAFNEDPNPSSKQYRLDMPEDAVTQEELVRHVIYSDHFSDDQEAMLSCYLIFQLEDDQQLLKKYKEGINGYWQAIKYSQNPLWYLIYQLTEPNSNNTCDQFGNTVIDTANWVLSRHPIDTTTYQAFVLGSRPDVIFEGQLSVDPSEVISVRNSTKDAQYVNNTKNYEISPKFDPINIYKIKPLPPDERSLHKYNSATYTNIDRGNKNNKEAATLFTLPYWLAVYHNMIVYDP